MPVFRVPIVLAGEPVTFIETTNPEVAALARDAFQVQWQYVHDRTDASELIKFLGRQIDGRPIEIDPAALMDQAYRGELDLTEVYREMFG